MPHAKPAARQISTLPFEQQERAIANMQRAGKLPGPVNPPQPRTTMWCGHSESDIVKVEPSTGAVVPAEQAKDRNDLVEVCGKCS